MKGYYKIDHRDVEGNESLFSIRLLPDYCAYAGHFPGNPVSPGVCNIQMIKECAESLTGQRLFLAFINKCRFSAVVTPQTTPQLQLRMHLSKAEDLYKVRATLFDDSTTYVDFNGELKTETTNEARAEAACGLCRARRSSFTK